jgi:DNA-binding GntR family transcriptional regulator
MLTIGTRGILGGRAVSFVQLQSVLKNIMPKKSSASSNGSSATERVEAYVRQAIYSGVFKPRQRLTEESLAAALKCSRGPIREAILRLERDGLVETIPRRGTFIPDVSPESIEVVFRMRGKLEGLCVRYMREVMSPAMAQRLTGILAQMKTATQKEDEEGFLEADLLLHKTIWEFSARPQLERVLGTVMNSRGFLIARTFSSSLPFRTRMKHHEDYLDIVLHTPIGKVETEVEHHFVELYTQIFGGSSARHLIASL